jgi:hypothetical protein
MVHQSRKKEHLAKEQPMGNAVITDSPYAGVQQDFPARARRRITFFDRVEIFDEI